MEVSDVFVAAVLFILSGVFYAAGHHEIGGFSADVCRYGSAFCDSPVYVLAGAGPRGGMGQIRQHQLRLLGRPGPLVPTIQQRCHERRSNAPWILDLTRFLYAKRFPPPGRAEGMLRSKTL